MTNEAFSFISCIPMLTFWGDKETITQFSRTTRKQKTKRRYYRPSRAKSLRNEIDLEFSPIFPSSIVQIFFLEILYGIEIRRGKIRVTN